MYYLHLNFTLLLNGNANILMNVGHDDQRRLTEVYKVLKLLSADGGHFHLAKILAVVLLLLLLLLLLVLRGSNQKEFLKIQTLKTQNIGIKSKHNFQTLTTKHN